MGVTIIVYGRCLLDTVWVKRHIVLRHVMTVTYSVMNNQILFPKVAPIPSKIFQGYMQG